MAWPKLAAFRLFLAQVLPISDFLFKFEIRASKLRHASNCSQIGQMLGGGGLILS